MELPATLVLATRGAQGRPALARVVGLRLSADREVVDAFASRSQWPLALAALRPGAPAALTICNPKTYASFQIKGRVADVAAADADDCILAERRRSDIGKVLLEIGVEPRLAARFLTTEDLVRVRLIPLSVFLQTPGPRAGALRRPDGGSAA